ncbi:MAG: hypothetical protein LH631_04100 [Alkalinema sp. CAN_BIN05]|nr:hypothetical protein [Alkalinema sp. CAN_BIN05]
MALHTPFNFVPVRRPVSDTPVSDTPISDTRVKRSSASSPRRRYGPFFNLSRTIVKLLFLALIGLTLSVLLFGVFNHDSHVTLLVRIWSESWKPLVVIILTTTMLAAIEESMS